MKTLPNSQKFTQRKMRPDHRIKEGYFKAFKNRMEYLEKRPHCDFSKQELNALKWALPILQNISNFEALSQESGEGT